MSKSVTQHFMIILTTFYSVNLQPSPCGFATQSHTVVSHRRAEVRYDKRTDHHHLTKESSQLVTSATTLAYNDEDSVASNEASSLVVERRRVKAVLTKKNTRSEDEDDVVKVRLNVQEDEASIDEKRFTKVKPATTSKKVGTNCFI